MITQNLVPEIYYKESRDFSYLGRILEVIFNYNKSGADLVGTSAIDSNISPVLIELLATTIGFESKHEYIVSDLVAVCSAFIHLLRKKGTISAITDSINILLNTQNINTSFDLYVETDSNGNVIDPYHLIIEIPYNMQDVVLLEDLFEYILPVGITYSFVKVKEASSYSNKVFVGTTDSVSVHKINTMDSSQISDDSNSDESEYNLRSMTYTTLVVGEDEKGV